MALKLIEDGWSIRNRVTWAKTTTMPSSVRDRLAAKSEVIYFLTRSRRYYFDLDAIRVPHRSAARVRHQQPSPASSEPAVATVKPSWAGPLAGSNSGLIRMKAAGRVGHPLGKNPGDVWTLAASNYRGAHFATFPPALVIRPLLATCPERVCSACGTPWARQPAQWVNDHYTRGQLAPACECAGSHRPGVVLDPFMGAGTVGLVAERHGRDWLGIELHPDFAKLARERIMAARTESGPHGK